MMKGDAGMAVLEALMRPITKVMERLSYKHRIFWVGVIIITPLLVTNYAIYSHLSSNIATENATR